MQGAHIGWYSAHCKVRLMVDEFLTAVVWSHHPTTRARNARRETIHHRQGNEICLTTHRAKSDVMQLKAKTTRLEAELKEARAKNSSTYKRDRSPDRRRSGDDHGHYTPRRR